MRRLTLELPNHDLKLSADLLEAEAPHSCATLRALLPLSSKLYPAKRDGQVLFLFLPADRIDVPAEHETSRPAPGDLLLFVPEGEPDAGSREEWPKLLLVYGSDTELVYPLDRGFVARPANLVGRVTGSLGVLKEAGDRIWREGLEQVRLTES